ncbi:MAG: hypothetical protein ACPLXC_01690 [Candidatus Pacearchaeota archaeon]
MPKTLKDFGYVASLILESDYLIPLLQETIKNKTGFLEVRQEEVMPVYKIEHGEISSIAVIGAKADLMDLVLEQVEREDILKSFAKLNCNKKKYKIAFYNKNQPIEKMLKFHKLKEPIILDEKFFMDLAKYIS